jgi:hypothetical protein
MGVRTDQAVTSFTAVKIKKATSDPGNNANKDYYKQIHIFEIEDTAASSIDDDVIGITQRAAGQGEPVKIVVSGMTTAKVNVTNLAHKYAKTTATAGELESTDEKTVIRIVDAQNTGSESLCKVLLGAGAAAGVIQSRLLTNQHRPYPLTGLRLLTRWVQTQIKMIGW